MDALELLHNRVSCPALAEPGPTKAQLDNIYQAALRAPDHGAIRPWRFLTITGSSRERLGELFLQAALADNSELAPERQEKTRKMPLRAPTLIVVIAAVCDHPKVPQLEQEVSAGCAAQNIILAAHAQGVGAMWRTGEMAYHPLVKSGLGVKEEETIIGYIYLGTAKKLRNPPQHDQETYATDWHG
ncbi:MULTISPECIES: nitroreductase family protein [unclassified Neptuniibacter]|jgi:nitroreductase|uniref:nitroreductase family protein n=1 Tax=unclassified Neptuniibacter TaxID=2630693 RepID=UPI0026E142B6|nr:MULTISPECIES: nitroreductase family protein [unclassified Neptuniibacter]MDO6513020.1 nitroreductase family protein [Neptuniibacter sp. 2_MG-2023]MDO6592568.1 nitroreductase family protein [Neptuniibacter sp. 1_MG-2023]